MVLEKSTFHKKQKTGWQTIVASHLVVLLERFHPQHQWVPSPQAHS
jgi:hypothetical protein